ncbi:hypothetical protein [Legionella sp. CNM-4043-24]|uniref:hypothetical protein n=1 Tax=Legionella sp. CNM-4043-24 TaxID=3421646 RepID=UPI00403AAE92
MSRSHRKNPIMGITTCASERQDKKIWHQRWRARERTSLNRISFEDLDSYLPLSEKEVSNVWQMGKDGKQYWSIQSQVIAAMGTAQNKGRTPEEKLYIEQRQLHKAMSK